MKIINRKIKELIRAEYNPRELTKDQENQLKDSLQRFGVVDPVIVNINPERKDIIVGGHQRTKVWEMLGNDTIPTVEVDLTLEKEKELNVRLNKNTGQFDMDMLANHFDTDELLDWGFTEQELDFFEPESLEAEEDDYEMPDEVHTDIVPGDLFEIGEHRLLCGDSTNSDDVEKLMNGEKADMVFTDPPYNVDYGNSNNPRHKSRTIMNDKMTDDDWDDFVSGYMGMLLTTCKGNIYISMSDKELGHMQEKFTSLGGKWASFIIWVKDRLVLSGKDYHSRHETILYGWPEGAENRQRVEDRTENDVWEIKRPSTSDLHPTMKPIELLERCLKNSSRQGDTILDLFGGSGTTMVASNMMKRKARLMELDPKYCQVIVDRMMKLDDKLAVKVNGKEYKPSKELANV